MKLKKKVKRTLIILLAVIVVVVGGIVGYKMLNKHPEVKATKVVHTIKKYGYNLKDNKTKRYKNMFYELEKILKEDPVDEEKYVKKITEMFIYDFYSLEDKTAKTDIGGVDFIHPVILQNFLQNAENTFYKYVESNIYSNRKQTLPVVDEIKIGEIKTISYEYNDTTDEKAYEVPVSWTYTSSKYDNYQKEATLIFVHNEIKLCLVELQ